MDSSLSANLACSLHDIFFVDISSVVAADYDGKHYESSLIYSFRLNLAKSQSPAASMLMLRTSAISVKTSLLRMSEAKCIPNRDLFVFEPFIATIKSKKAVFTI